MSTRLAPGLKVNITNVQHRPDKASPWIVKWKVGNKWHSRSFKLKVAADDYWARLFVANRDGERFDRDTGLPPGFEVAASEESFASYAKQVFDSYHAQSSPKTRRANAQAFSVVIPLMVKRSRRSTAPEDIRGQIQGWLANETDIPKWVARSSIPLSEISTEFCRAVERDIKTMKVKDHSASKRAGMRVEKPISPRDVQRYTVSINSILNDAVKHKAMLLNPWPKDKSVRTFKKDRIEASKTIHVNDLPSVEECHRFIRYLENEHPASTGYQIIAYLLFYLGLRPAEALALSIENLRLPDDGWGEAFITVAVTDAGDRWTSEQEKVGLTKMGTSRRVPIPPVMVKRLNDWIGERTSGLLVPTRSDKTVSQTNLARAFRRASDLSGIKVQPYTLRHVSATVMLGAGVSLGEAARRLGHSPKVLMETYLGVLGDDEASANDRLSAVFTE